MAMEPSTPRRCKRPRLARHLSDEKENVPCGQSSTLMGQSSDIHKAPVNVETRATFPRTASSPLQPFPRKASTPLQQIQLPDNQAAIATSPPACTLQQQAQVYPLIGREDECGQLDCFLQQSLSHGPGNGRCLYISGGPGTGKTCSVRASVGRWQQQAPDTHVLEVNCMDLAQRSVHGVLQRLLDKMGSARTAARSMQGLAALAACKLAHLSKRIVIIVDEVDQLINRSRAASGALSLETLFSLPHLPGAPAVAIIAIANAVDLLERAAVLSHGVRCSTLLFEAYNKEQLKNIVTSRVKALDGGEAALKALGPVKVELRLRKVAKECGDCRQVLSLIEEAAFEARSACDAARQSSLQDGARGISSEEGGEVVPLLKRQELWNQTNRNDPLKAISQLPLEQQILLSALATSKKEAARVTDICSQYKELCRALRQPDNLGSRGQVNNALSALEQRGLLELRNAPNTGRGRRKIQASSAETTVELSVSCDALRESIVEAVPLLQRYMD